jgi:hypothetical protein
MKENIRKGDQRTAMHKFVMTHGEVGFSKAGAREMLGELFSENLWRNWASMQSRHLSPEFYYHKETGEWFFS